jgi:hypothetical protein
VGCVLYELMTLRKAFDGSSLPALVGRDTGARHQLIRLTESVQQRFHVSSWEGSTTVRLSFTLSSGEIPSFYVQGDIRRCDWLEKPHNLETQTELIQKRELTSQSQHRISPCTSNNGISPDDSG